MEEYQLGPNGGMMCCMEYLENNLDWLLEKLKPLKGRISNALETKTYERRS
jgi:hypothetical protein